MKIKLLSTAVAAVLISAQLFAQDAVLTDLSEHGIPITIELPSDAVLDTEIEGSIFITGENGLDISITDYFDDLTIEEILAKNKKMTENPAMMFDSYVLEDENGTISKDKGGLCTFVLYKEAGGQIYSFSDGSMGSLTEEEAKLNYAICQTAVDANPVEELSPEDEAEVKKKEKRKKLIGVGAAAAGEGLKRVKK